MSMEFIDGFDHYNGGGNLPRKWNPTSGNYGAGAGRFAGNSLAVPDVSGSSSAVTKTLTPVATRVMGFSILPSSYGTTTPLIFCGFKDGGNIQVDLRYNSSAALYVTRAGTQIGGPSTGLLTPGVWAYVEFKAIINSTTGAFEVRLNGVTVLSATGVNTQATGNASMDTIFLSSNYGTTYYDDLYVLNSSGSANNDFLGECRILTALPTGDSAANLLWTPSPSGAHYVNVNESSPDDDTTYNYSNVVGRIDTYTFPAITPTGAIAAVQSTITARRDDISPRSIREEVRGSDGNNYDGAVTFPLITSYDAYCTVRENDPTIISPWTPTSLNATEFGVKLAA